MYDIKKLKQITDFLGEENVFLQLAEESSELVQAILKYKRAKEGLTPKTVEECRNNVVEELADVLLNIEQVYSLHPEFMEEIEKVQEFKTNRWFKRLKLGKGEE